MEPSPQTGDIWTAVPQQATQGVREAQWQRGGREAIQPKGYDDDEPQCCDQPTQEKKKTKGAGGRVSIPRTYTTIIAGDQFEGPLETCPNTVAASFRGIRESREKMAVGHFDIEMF